MELRRFITYILLEPLPPTEATVLKAAECIQTMARGWGRPDWQMVFAKIDNDPWKEITKNLEGGD